MTMQVRWWAYYVRAAQHIDAEVRAAREGAK